MKYRTKTYIAGDWTGDQDFIQQLYDWNQSDYWALSFLDAHRLTQSRDTSKPCSIKRSLSERLDASKTFVLVVGDKTNSLTKGSCQFCRSYYYQRCNSGRSVDYRSFIQYECEKAKRDGLNIVVIYNSIWVDKDKCLEVLKYTGKHIPGYKFENRVVKYNYEEIKQALMGC